MSETKRVPPYFADCGCFFCSPTRPDGLRLTFEEVAGEEPMLRLRWLASPTFTGFGDILHGGIQGALFDEIMGWCSRHFTGEAGVTKCYRVEFFSPVYVGREIELTCRVAGRRGRETDLEAELFDADGKRAARAEGTYVSVSPERFEAIRRAPVSSGGS